jgi:uridine kinase
LIKKDETILNAQRAKIFIDDIAKKKAAKKIKRLNQRRRFSQAKAKLEQKVSGDTAGASCSGDSALANETCTDENEAGGEKEEEAEFSEMREEEMIYFEE